jgi:hypothetical protein
VAAPATAPPAPAARREVRHDRQPFRFDGDDRGTHGDLVGPVVRIETTRAFNQSVPFFRRAGAPRDALQHFGVAGPKTRGGSGAERLAQQRRVFAHDRRCALRDRRPFRRAGLRPAARDRTALRES